jgi:AcrR family transcriptional regulator
MTPKKTPKTRDIQRQQTYQRLFDAALAEFSRVGVDEARITTICAHAGVAKGTFFFHFPTKDHVLLAQQRQLSKIMAERIETELSCVANAREFLNELTTIVHEVHDSLGDIKLVRQINLAILRNGGAQTLGIRKTAFGEALVKQINQLQQQGILCPDTNATHFADCLRLSLFGFLINPQSSFEHEQPALNLLIDSLAASLTV